jgi:MFS family permease
MFQSPAQLAELSDADRLRFVRRNTALLTLAQGSIWMTVGVFVAASPVAVARFSGRPWLGGFLFTIWALSLAAGAQVAGLVMDRRGRRPGLAGGQTLLGLASLTACVSVLNASTIGLMLACVLGGAGAGAALLGRAAVADMYSPERRGTAVGFMLAAGTVGAIIGPQLVQVTRLLAPGTGQYGQMALAWFIAAVASAGALGCVLALRPDPKELAPRPAVVHIMAKRPLRTLVQLPALRFAIFAVALAQFAMVGLMSVYGIAVSARGIGLGLIALILSAHFSGMFAFSPAWGIFLDRIGRREGLLGAAALIMIGGFLAGLPQVAVSALGLFLVGLGWSGSYLGATAVVSDVTRPVERGTALGFTDLVTAGASAAGSLTLGVLLEWSGFPTVGASVGSLLLLGLLALLVVPAFSWKQPAAARAG